MQTKNYEIIMKNKFESWERQILSTLYLPIIGFEAFTLYLALLNDAEFSKTERNISFDINHLEIMTSMSENKIEASRKILESLKLIKTFENRTDNSLVLYLFSPLEPDDFFNAPLLNNLLIARIGSDEYEKIRFLLRESSKNLSNHMDISANFNEVFPDATKYPDFDHEISFNTKNAHRKLEISSSEFEIIKSILGKQDIVIDFSEMDLKMLAEIKDAYNLNETQVAEGIKFAYDFKLAKLSRRKLCDKANELINQVDEIVVSPTEDVRNKREMVKALEFEMHKSEAYLKAITKSKSISPTEIALIKELRNSYKLHDSVINALIDFSYLKNDRKVVANYILKIGATLSEKAINSPIAAMNYLKDAFKVAKNPTSFKKNPIPKKPSEYVSSIDWTNDFFKEDLNAMDMNEENIEEIMGKIG